MTSPSQIQSLSLAAFRTGLAMTYPVILVGIQPIHRPTIQECQEIW